MRQWNSGAMEVAADQGLGLLYLRISQLCIIDIWNHIVFLEVGGGAPVHWKMLSSIPDLHSLITPTQVMTIKMSPAIARCPLGTKPALTEKQGFRFSVRESFFEKVKFELRPEYVF